MAAAVVRREDAVFTARLALKIDRDRPSEMLVEVNMLAEGHFELNVGETKLLAILYRSPSSAMLRALRIVPVMEQEEDGHNSIDCIVLYPKILEHAEKHLLPFCRAAKNAAVYTKMKGDTYWSLDMLKMEKDKQQAIYVALVAYEAASKASENLFPAHPLRLPLILMKRAFYHDIMEWPECAIALGKRALEEPGPELASPSLDAEYYKYSAEVLGFIKENPKCKVPENAFKVWFETVSPPPPVVPHSVPAVAPDIFASPGDWGYDVHERLSLSEMMSRKKAARMRRGPMG